MKRQRENEREGRRKLEREIDEQIGVDDWKIIVSIYTTYTYVRVCCSALGSFRFD